MSYYLAPSLAGLRSEVNDRWPDRSKASDGWIGDPSHQARVSDHNPDYSAGGVVRAIDITVADIDVEAVLNATIHDPRVSYVIYNRQIWGGTRWRPYTGSNPHTKHIHVSLKHTKEAEEPGSWGVGTGSTKPTGSAPSKPSGGGGGGSVVDYLKSKGQDSSYAARAKLAASYGIKGYKGTASQNNELLAKLKAGKPSAPAPAPSKPSAPSKPKPSGYTGGSVVEYLKSVGKDSSYSARAKLAASYGIKGYKGTASQNTALLAKLRGGAKPSAPAKPKPSGYKGSSLVDYLKSVGKDSSYSARAKLAAKHGIKGYKGTAAQNSSLLKKLRG